MLAESYYLRTASFILYKELVKIPKARRRKRHLKSERFHRSLFHLLQFFKRRRNIFGGLNSAGNFYNVKIEIFTSCSCHNVGEIYQTWSDTCTCKVVVLRSFLMPSIEVITDIQLEEGAVYKEVKPEARVPLFPIFNILKLPVIFY